MSDRPTAPRSLPRPGDRGFTLVEMLIAVVLMGMIATSVVAGIGAVLRNDRSATALLTRNRNVQALATYLPADVGSTPPGGLETDPGLASGCPGDSGGVNFLRMTWTEWDSGTTTTYRVSYRGHVEGDSLVIRRHACQGAGSLGAVSTVTVSNELPTLPAGWAPGQAPVAATFDGTTLTIEVTQADGKVVKIRAARRNPAQFLPPPNGGTTLPPPVTTTTSTTTTTAAPATTVPAPTTTDPSATTTPTSSTTSTSTSTTTTTIPQCAVTSIVVSDQLDGDSTVRKKSNDRLRDSANVTVNTTGPCSGIVLRYTPGDPALVDKVLQGGPTVWTTTLDKNTDQWYGLGGQELRVVQGSRTVVWLYSVFTLVAG